MIGAAVAGLAVVGVGVLLLRNPSPAGTATGLPVATSVAQAPPTPAPDPPAPPAPSARDDAAVRQEAERSARAKFDAAIVDANRFLAAGDGQGATPALNIARDLDPASPAVGELSTRLVEHFRAETARRTAADPPRAQTPPRRPAAEPAPPPPARPVQAPLITPPVGPPPAAAPVGPAPAEVSAPAPVAPKPTPEPAPAPPPRPEPERRAVAPPPPAAPPVDDDDALIRRVVATYARAIETKDMALYRSVKPNLSAAEQRTIEDGFRAVTSQRVTVTIQSIEHRGQDARVQLRRHDVIQAGGRQQTADSQQTLTLARGASGWVIREIGR